MNKNVILYYFTGTGNTKLMADTAMQELEKQGYEVEIRDMAKKESHPAGNKDMTFGFVFPVYALTLPRLVERFMKNMPGRKSVKYFLIANAHTNTGRSRRLARQILGGKGYELIGSLGTYTPSSSIITEETEPLEKAAKMREEAVASVKNFISALMNNRIQIEVEKKLAFKEKAVSLLFTTAMPGLLLKKTTVNDNCTSCGQCQRLCPVGNIKMVDGKPSLGKNCEVCMRCINFCPAGAIEMMSSPGRSQYREPLFEKQLKSRA